MNPELLLCATLALGGTLPDMPAIAGHTNSLRIVVIPSRSGVRVNESFKVALRVENPTESNQSVRVMSCSWDAQWKTSNTNVVWKRWPCTRNVATNIKIPPGGAYTNELEMFVLEPVLENSFSFRMGFTPLDNEKTFWSDDVIIGISSQTEINEEITNQIFAILAECQKIKPGMSRAALLKTFTPEGGLSTARHQRFVYRGCPYIKVDVDFNVSDSKQRVNEARATDTISKISKPYLDWTIMD